MACVIVLSLFLCFFVSCGISSTPGVSTDPNDVAFYLYPNKDISTDTDLLVFNDINSIKNSRYDPSKNLILYASGFMQNYTTDQAIKNAYLQVPAFTNANNIIVIDWGALSGNKANPALLNITQISQLGVLPLYIDAIANVEIVGKRVQEFISFLSGNGQLLATPASVHLVGQSLGAHVMGVAGGLLKSAGLTVARITGTEPAGILYQVAGLPIVPADQRLDITDATRVDIVHTNAGVAGWSGSLGHVDFWVNAGLLDQAVQIQSACLQPANLTDIFCSHNLAVKFYADSILDTAGNLVAYCCNKLSLLSCLFPNGLLGGIGCSSSARFGEYISTSTTGNYYLNITG